jgi:hypothetical protein
MFDVPGKPLICWSSQLHQGFEQPQRGINPLGRMTSAVGPFHKPLTARTSAMRLTGSHRLSLPAQISLESTLIRDRQD